MSSVETPEVYLLQSAENQRLIDALEKLSGVDKEILKLATWEKLSDKAIAQLLGISESAVGKRMSRARPAWPRSWRESRIEEICWFLD
jgi:RNA polymerase sigma factor (sigma-70 family)